MNYYPFHIGDFRSGTAHLTDAEELAYRRALDWYYDTETQIPLETQWVARRLRVDTQVLENVLKDFFEKTEAGWRHGRCEAEIIEYRKRADKNRANGAKGGRPKKEKKPNGFPDGCESDANGMPVETQLKGNQEPRTNNQEPVTNTPHTPQGVGGGDVEPHHLPRPTGGGAPHPLAGAACLAMKKTGIGIMNPSHPKLNALLHAGVSLDQLLDACRRALDAGKTFSYAMGIVEREEKEARELANTLAKPKMQRQQQKPMKSFAQQDREAEMLRWEEMTGRKHPEMEKIRQQERGEIVMGDVVEVAPGQMLLGG